jgi:hypothetical protein
MDIREARPEDNEALQALQLRCPQGQKLIVSAVNTPDFFAIEGNTPAIRWHDTAALNDIESLSYPE